MNQPQSGTAPNHQVQDAAQKHLDAVLEWHEAQADLVTKRRSYEAATTRLIAAENCMDSARECYLNRAANGD